MSKYYRITGLLFLTLALNLSAPLSAQDLDWGINWGSSSYDLSEQIAVDAQGNVYVTGIFRDTTDLEAGPGQHLFISNGGNDFYLAKYNDKGQFLWGHAFGSTGNEAPYDLEIDNLGNVLVCGAFQDTIDFDPFGGTTILGASAGFTDGFVCCYSPSGGLIWAKQFAGTGNIIARSVAAGPSGFVAVSGEFRDSVDLDPGVAKSMAISPLNDMYLVKLDMNGDFVWGFGTTGGDVFNDPHEVEFDKVGNLYMAGDFRNSVDMDPGPNTSIITSTTSTNTDGFLAKYDGAGNFKWVEQIHGNGSEFILDMSVDTLGFVYIGGRFWFTCIFDSGGVNELTFDTQSLLTGADGMLAKYDTNGIFHWAIQIEGSFRDQTVNSLDCDRNGNVIVGGIFNDSLIIDPGASTAQFYQMGTTNDLYFALYDSAGVLQESWSSGNSGLGAQDAISNGIDLADNGTIHMCGNFQDSLYDIDPDTGFGILVSAGSWDPYILKYNGCPIPSSPGTIFGDSAACEGDTIMLLVPSIFGATGYTWGLPAGWTGAMSNDTIWPVVGPSGVDGTITCTADNVCGSSTSAMKLFNGHPNPVLQFSPLADTICDGDTTTLMVSGADTYQWFPPGTLTPTSGSTISAYPSMNTTYTVDALSAAGCIASATITIVVHTTPTKPSITETLGVLSSSSGANYQWFFNDTLIVGASSQDYTPTQNGDYKVVITNAFGCEATSDPFSFLVGSWSELNGGLLKLYPNPNHGEFVINIREGVSNYSLKVYDLNGRTLSFTQKRNGALLEIKLGDLASGLYRVQLNWEDNQAIGSLLVN